GPGRGPDQHQGQARRAARGPGPPGGDRRDGGGTGGAGGRGVSLRVYNSLSREKEELRPIAAGEVGIYVCGVTGYDLTHIGHARSALVFDVIPRHLAFRG